VETRKALKKASPGDIVVVEGTHATSKDEIPMAVRALKMKLLIGHSKGNLVISEALFKMKAKDSAHLKRLGKQILVVTVSAKIAMPPDFEHIIDINGQIDGFGALNSRWDLGTEVTVPFAWHHTNTELPMHLPVTQTLRKLPEIGQL
jgi:TusA-related sulfurtransferase